MPKAWKLFKNKIFTIIALGALLHCNVAFGLTQSVPGNGTLSTVISNINTSGSSSTGNPASDNTINITSGPISLGSDLPIITRGLTIVGSGNMTITGNNNRIFATKQSSLSLQNLTLTGGKARGGNGSLGGGGGMGAGGGVYVDAGSNLTLLNTTIQSCNATGGTGGVGNLTGGTGGAGATGGGGGGASFLNSQDADNTGNGGGLYSGQSLTPGRPSTQQGGQWGDLPHDGPQSGTGGLALTGTNLLSSYTGYGGGAGGADAMNSASFAAGGGSGTPSTNTAQGTVATPGGYCAGGGGMGTAGKGGNPGGGGGGGGNGGGNGALAFTASSSGGGGGGFGGGGGVGLGAYDTGSNASGGGGGGFGGGGGAGGNTSGSTFYGGGAGGGGGFGGGGGGRGVSSTGTPGAGSGGTFGGTGGFVGTSGVGAVGGGGAAIGGAIFVGDGSSLTIQDGTSISGNSVTAGSATLPAQSGAAVAPDIFLFKGTQVTFSPATSLSVPYSIQRDTTAPTGFKDNGVTISATNNSTVTFSSTINNYYGPTTITSGILSAGVLNLPPANAVTIQGGATFALTAGGGTSTYLITNSGGTLTISGGATINAPITNSVSGTNTGTINITGATILSSTLTNDGIINITSTFQGTGTLLNNSDGIINLNNGGIFTKPTTFTNTGRTNINTGGNISGAFTGGTNAILSIGDTSAANFATSGTISGISTLQTVTNGTSFTINNAVTGNSNAIFTINGTNSSSSSTTTTVNMAASGSLNNFTSIIVNGVYNILAGASYTLGPGSNLTGNSAGTGAITNSGQFYINSSNVSFAGSFKNLTTGSFTITGTPSILFSGPTFANQGNLNIAFNSNNGLPQIQLPSVVSPSNLDLASGIINISYNSNYIAGRPASNPYTFLSAGTPPVAGIAILPAPSRYISSWSLVTSGNTLGVAVVRDGFGNHALTPTAQEIGNFLEAIGSSGTTSSAFTSLLNSLEKIDNDAELTTALDSLLPPSYTPLVTIQNIDSLLGAVEVRMANQTYGYAAGSPGADAYGFWVRPFSSNGTQQSKGTLVGYKDSGHGYLIGLDRSINNNLTLGLAGSLTKTLVNQTDASGDTTNINSYDFLFYGTYQPSANTYIDGVVSGGVSNYHGLNTLSFPGYLQTGSSNYTTQQITTKIMASRMFPISSWQFTPRAMAQYSFIRQLPYTETGLGPYDVYTDPGNINLFRLGLGAGLGMPFLVSGMLSIPSVYGMMYVDAKGGAVDTSSSFISGGPIITNTVQQSRLLYKLGVAYELKFNDNFQMILNYDRLSRRGFQGHEAFLSLRYTF